MASNRQINQQTSFDTQLVGLYHSPATKAVVLCVDEKSQIKALDRMQPILPITPRLPERRTYDYIRHGTITLFAALDVATGEVIGQLHRRHRSSEFLKLLSVLNERTPTGAEVYVVMDNYASTRRKR